MVLLALACSEPPVEADPPTEAASDDACAGLTARAWDPSGAAGAYDALAPNFTLPTLDGDFTLSERYTGCDSLIAVRYTETYPDFGARRDNRNWLESSPPNVLWMFLVEGRDEDERVAATETLRTELEDALGGLDEDLAGHWRERLVYVTANANNTGTWIDDLPAGVVHENWAIDRFQRVRELGYLADPVTGWTEAPPTFLTYEAEYFNMESDRQDRLDAEDAEVLRVFENTDLREATVSLPADLAGYDTLELDLSFICNGHPDASGCGEWDYLAYVYLCEDAAGTGCVEMGRFITAYARPGRWLVDASPFLARMASGGTAYIRANSANAPYITLDLRFSNRNKGHRPFAMEYLWSGGSFDAAYNSGREAIQFTPPAGTTRVDLFAIVSGHGFGNDKANCAEFCNHQHEFTVNGAQTWTHEFTMAGTSYGCAEQISLGTVPGQYGTWTLGRGGWCPGKQVDPWTADLTGAVSLTGENSIAYRGLYEGADYVPEAVQNGSGFGGRVDVATWLVYSR